MGSKSDLPVMKDAINILDEFGIESEVNIVSAHRTPGKMFSYAREAKNKGCKVIIAGAGGAAHLPGMVASITTLPSLLLLLWTLLSPVIVAVIGEVPRLQNGKGNSKI